MLGAVACWGSLSKPGTKSTQPKPGCFIRPCLRVHSVSHGQGGSLADDNILIICIADCFFFFFFFFPGLILGWQRNPVCPLWEETFPTHL